MTAAHEVPAVTAVAAELAEVTGVAVPGVPHARTRNSMRRTGWALLVNTALTGGLGLLFWVVAARFFKAAEVGHAAALISALALLSGLGMLNLSGALMRFLPATGQRSKQFVRTVYAASAAASLVIAVVAIAVIDAVVGPHSSLRLGWPAAIVFTVANVISAIFTLEDSVFIGIGAASPYVPAENAAFGLAKLVLLAGFASTGSYFGLFSSWVVPLCFIVPVMNWLLFRRLLPAEPAGLRRQPVSRSARATVLKFWRGDASGGLFNLGWTYCLPLIVTARLGTVANSSFYVAFLFTTSLDLVGSNLAAAMTVEGSHKPGMVGALARVTAKRVLLIVVPVVVLGGALATPVLHIYGSSYAAGGAMVLRLLLITSIPKTVAIIYYGVCRVQHRTQWTAVLQAFTCVSVLTSTWFVAPKWGLTGIGCSVLAVHLVLLILVTPDLLRTMHARGKHHA